MSKILIRDIVALLEEAFPPTWQEDFDNTGLQIGEEIRPCTGVLLCVDATPEVVVEAYEKGCNLIISHHPLIFHPIKRITSMGRVDRTIYKAIKNDIAIYSCHTSVDNAPGIGVSWQMGRMMGMTDMSTLEGHDDDEIGAGIIGRLQQPLEAEALVALVKSTFSSPIVRCSSLDFVRGRIERVTLCGGAGSFLLPKAIEAGAQAFIASDCKHNHFIDHLGQIFLVDLGHYEAEACTKRIFYQIIREKIPNFALYYSELETNPIIYL